MALGSLLDAGADVDEVRSMVERLPVRGWGLEAEAVLRCGIAATKAHVHVEETTVVRTASHIAALVEEARLPERVRRRALAVFGALADAEGRLHRRPPEQVHFHEVGGLDAIVDVVGTCAALEVLEIDALYSSVVVTGTGHGPRRPRPAPEPRPGGRRAARGGRRAHARARPRRGADDADRAPPSSPRSPPASGPCPR